MIQFNFGMNFLKEGKYVMSHNNNNNNKIKENK